MTDGHSNAGHFKNEESVFVVQDEYPDVVHGLAKVEDCLGVGSGGLNS